MVDPKNDGKNPTENQIEEEWDFTTVKPAVKYGENESTESQVKDTKVVERKKPKLTLDESNPPKSKTRSEMAAELMKGNVEEEDEDEFVYASYEKRALALIIDLIIMGVLAVGVQYITPLSRKLLQIFLDRYKLEFIFPGPVVMNILLIVNMAIAIFFFIVIPVSFYNQSFGKKMMGLKMRSVDHVRINLDQAMTRELVYKPLGILMIAGFFVPFFNKKKQAMHDFQSDTLVIEE